MAKPNPNLVHPSLIRKIIEEYRFDPVRDRKKLFSEYIRLHFYVTGNLAPGCDAKDFYAALDEYMANRNSGTEPY